MTLKKYIGSRSKHFLIIILHTTSTTKVILLINLKKKLRNKMSMLNCYIIKQSI